MDYVARSTVSLVICILWLRLCDAWLSLYHSGYEVMADFDCDVVKGVMGCLPIA